MEKIYFSELEECWKLLGYENALLLSAWAKNFLTDLMYDLNFGRRCYFTVNSVMEEALIFFFTSPELVWRYLFVPRTQRYLVNLWHRSYERFIRQRLDQRAQSGYDSKLKPDALNLLLDLKEESANGGDNYRMAEEDIRTPYKKL
ncbi:8547_t:CDS:2 [Ambispora leptoticha]|uniref:8547_t:CDS:1 n=1 Tax=Ambispora leptoticha TaxID=144679 RepID=A0A9N9EEZ5_9GLOM|nr:8547_t:CDS:2 [Ambispora leptoticha]